MPVTTPTPWTYDDYNEITGPNGQTVLGLTDDGACGDPDCCGPASYRLELDKEDGRLIVAAVNAHEELLHFARWSENICADKKLTAEQVRRFIGAKAVEVLETVASK